MFSVLYDYVVAGQVCTHLSLLFLSLAMLPGL